MGELTVRRLGGDDVALATRVAHTWLGESGVTTAHLTELLTDSRSIVIAAINDGEPLGYLVAYWFPSLDGDRLAYLYDIEVALEHRRRGIARSMVEELLSISRQTGIESIWVGSSLTNTAACELWRATGATRDGDQYVEFTFDCSHV